MKINNLGGGIEKVNHAIDGNRHGSHFFGKPNIQKALFIKHLEYLYNING